MCIKSQQYFLTNGQDFLRNAIYNLISFFRERMRRQCNQAEYLLKRYKNNTAKVSEQWKKAIGAKRMKKQYNSLHKEKN